MKQFEIIEVENLEGIDGGGFKEAGQAIGGTLLVAGGVISIASGNVGLGVGLIGTGIAGIGNATH